MQLCRDCKFRVKRYQESSTEFWRCGNPAFYNANSGFFVNAEKHAAILKFCEDIRRTRSLFMIPSMCSGFKRKVSLLKRLFRYMLGR